MMKRYLSSAPIGFAVTLSLLYAMHALIDSGNDVFTTPRKADMLGWIAQPVKEEPPLVEQLPERVDPPVIPPSPTPPTTLDPNGDRIHVTLRPNDPAPPSDTGFSLHGYSDGPLVHMIRVKPNYPSHAATKGIEGFVTVRFDVTAEGLASNVIVVESSHGIFEKSAVKAAQKFRFKPKVVDGVPVATTGVSYRFRFEMDN